MLLPSRFPPELSDKVLFLLLILDGSWSLREAPAVGVNQHLVAHASVWGKSQSKETETEREQWGERCSSCIPPFCFSVRNHQETLSTFRLSMSLSWRDKNTGAATSLGCHQQLLSHKPYKSKTSSGAGDPSLETLLSVSSACLWDYKKNTAHHSLIHMGFNSCRPLRVLDLCSESPALGPLSKRTWPGWSPHSFTPREWASACKWFTWGTEGTRVHHGKKASKWLQSDAFNDILLTNMLLMSVAAPSGVSVKTVLAAKTHKYVLFKGLLTVSK